MLVLYFLEALFALIPMPHDLTLDLCQPQGLGGQFFGNLCQPIEDRVQLGNLIAVPYDVVSQPLLVSEFLILQIPPYASNCRQAGPYGKDEPEPLDDGMVMHNPWMPACPSQSRKMPGPYARDRASTL